MNRLTLLGVAGALFAAPVATAQTTTTPAAPGTVGMTADTLMTADSTVAVRIVDTDGARVLYRAGYALAGASADEASLRGALGKFDEALVADDTFPPALYGRANALGRLGRLEEARAGYEAAIAASQGEANKAYRDAATTALAEVETIIADNAVVAAQNAAIERQNTAVAAQTVAVGQAAALLAEFPLTAENATTGYAQLEAAREAGYDANLLSFYYAKALNALGRGAEALPYAQQALDASTDADKSAYYIQVGLANRFAGDDAAARIAFQEAKTGSWSSWADHYLAEMGDAPAPGTDG